MAGVLAAVVTVMVVAGVAAAPYCVPGVDPAYAFGFKALHDALGAEMGDPLECEHGNPENGDTLQQTTNGLSFYRQSTNTPTFTNGWEHWALTVRGLLYWTGVEIDPPDDAATVTPPTSFVPGPVIDPDEVQQSGLPEGLVQELFLTDLEFPVSMVWTPDGSMYFSEKHTGNVRLYDGERLVEEPFVHLTVNGEIERGVLGVTVNPAYEDNGFVYVFYTNAEPLVNRLTRFRAVGGKGVEPVVLFEAPITTGFKIHNGGNMAFGPDGMLYVTLGENNNGFWSRELDVPYGKILRINPADGTAPADNPFYDDGDPTIGNDDRIWAYGLRNPFDLAFRPESGELFVTESGPECDDEINLILPGGDYGWWAEYPCPGGFGWGLPSVQAFTPTMTPTGLVFYQGGVLGAYAGDLFFCSWTRGYLMHAALGPPGVDGMPVVERLESWGGECGTDITVGPDGFLYMSNSWWGEAEGTIYRVLPAALATEPPAAEPAAESPAAEPAAESPAAESVTEPAETAVSMEDFFSQPIVAVSHAETSLLSLELSQKTIFASVGARITWTNADDVIHNLRALSGEFDQTLVPGESFEWQPDTPGTVRYVCAIHGNIHGVIVVPMASVVASDYYDGKSIKQYFADTCGGCHGPNREGGTGPALLPGRLPDNDEFYFDTIMDGREKTIMLAWSSLGLSAEETWGLIAFLRS